MHALFWQSFWFWSNPMIRFTSNCTLLPQTLRVLRSLSGRNAHVQNRLRVDFAGGASAWPQTSRGRSLTKYSLAGKKRARGRLTNDPALMPPHGRRFTLRRVAINRGRRWLIAAHMTDAGCRLSAFCPPRLKVGYERNTQSTKRPEDLRYLLFC